MDKNELMRFIGNNIRYYRMERKMTQEELSNLIGVNSSAITRIEGGTRMMSVPVLRTVADALGVSCDALLYNISESTEIANILHILSGQSKSSLTRISKILQVWVNEYGENE